MAVIEGLRDGTLEAIATDHAPHSSIEKDCAFAEAQNGVIGLQTALPLSLTLWRQHAMSPLTVVHRLSWGPARLLGLDASHGVGRIAVGGPADVALVDPDLRDAGAAAALHHLAPTRGLHLDVDLLPLLSSTRQQRPGLVTVGTPFGRVHHDLRHRDLRGGGE